MMADGWQCFRRRHSYQNWHRARGEAVAHCFAPCCYCAGWWRLCCVEWCCRGGRLLADRSVAIQWAKRLQAKRYVLCPIGENCRCWCTLLSRIVLGPRRGRCRWHWRYRRCRFQYDNSFGSGYVFCSSYSWLRFR